MYGRHSGFRPRDLGLSDPQGVRMGVIVEAVDQLVGEHQQGLGDLAGGATGKALTVSVVTPVTSSLLTFTWRR